MTGNFHEFITEVVSFGKDLAFDEMELLPRDFLLPNWSVRESDFFVLGTPDADVYNAAEPGVLST